MMKTPNLVEVPPSNSCALCKHLDYVYETGIPFVVPPLHPHVLGARFDKQLGEYVI